MNKELIWASGLFEGEGCISRCRPRGPLGRYVYPTLSLGSTDLDTLQRFHRAVLQLGHIYDENTPSRQRRMLKPFWTWRASSGREVRLIILLLFEGFGKRRREKALSTVAHFLR